MNGIFNIKYLLIASIIVFEIGSAVCGSAPKMNAIICGRIITGMGGAGMYNGSATNFFPRDRPLAHGNY
jgi:MFS family permease